VIAILKKLHNLLTREQKRKYILLQILFATTAVIQVAGIASLAPFIALLSNQRLIHENPILAKAYAYLNCTSDIAFLMLFAAAIMVFIVVSNAVAAFAMWASVTFSQNLGVELQHAIYRSYLYKDHVYFSKNNSSHMIAMITQEAPRFTYMVLQPLLSLISQVFVAAIIAVGLLVVDPILAAVALIAIGASYIGIFRTIKIRLHEYGLKFHHANVRKFKLLNESIGGIKEVKLLGTEPKYEKELLEANTTNARANAILGLLGDLPKFIIETIAFCALLGLALYLLAKHGNSAQIISILSLYAMAGYKLLPAAQTIFKSASQIKGNRSALDALYPEVLEGRAVIPDDAHETSESVPGNADIHFLDVTYTYPGADSSALQQVNLRIPQNSLTAFVGPSGAGKSTMADLLLGFLMPSSGRMLVGDIEVKKSNRKSWQRHLGYVPQNIFLLDDTVTANIAFGVPEKEVDLQKVKEAARLANIDQFIESIPEQYNFVVGERGAMLSGGQKQRIGIARALYRDAEVLVLDEATSALDNITEREIIATILKLKASKTIIMIAHRLSTIKSADQVAYFENGKMESIGAFDELIVQSRKFRTMVQSTEEIIAEAPGYSTPLTQ
jgi:HlyD family secretion protein